MIKHIPKRAASLTLLKKRAAAAEKKVESLRTEIRALNKSILNLKKTQRLGKRLSYEGFAKREI